jgi:hypothetical protein
MTSDRGRITDVLVYDIRFPTSIGLDGSDASHPDPDYSATYVVLKTGQGLVFLRHFGVEIRLSLEKAYLYERYSLIIA